MRIIPSTLEQLSLGAFLVSELVCQFHSIRATLALAWWAVLAETWSFWLQNTLYTHHFQQINNWTLLKLPNSRPLGQQPNIKTITPRAWTSGITRLFSRAGPWEAWCISIWPPWQAQPFKLVATMCEPSTLGKIALKCRTMNAETKPQERLKPQTRRQIHSHGGCSARSGNYCRKFYLLHGYALSLQYMQNKIKLTAKPLLLNVVSFLRLYFRSLRKNE